MKKLFTEYFYYTRVERNGALVLSLLCAILFIAPQFFHRFTTKKESPDFEVIFASSEAVIAPQEKKSIATQLFDFNPNTASADDFEQLGLSPKLAKTIINYRNKGGKFYRKEDLQKIYTLKTEDYQRLEPYIKIDNNQTNTRKQHTQIYTNNYVREKNASEPFSFDPNTASKQALMQLGLSEQVSDNLIKYRERGGAFRKPEDFKKIYGVKDEDYKRLAPYLTFAEAEKPERPIVSNEIKKEQQSTFPARANQPIVVDVNQSDAAAWQQIRGIGPAYAKKIINFREKLGGFSSIEQIGETYGLPDSTFQQIKTQLTLSPVLRKLMINKASVEELRAHPYLDARKAAAIISYRAQHGEFQTVEELYEIKALSEEVIEKLKPYLSFE